MRAVFGEPVKLIPIVLIKHGILRSVPGTVNERE